MGSTRGEGGGGIKNRAYWQVGTVLCWLDNAADGLVSVLAFVPHQEVSK